MRRFFAGAPPSPEIPDERPPKRMSTPAGERLTIIMEGGADEGARAGRAPRLSLQNRSSVIGLPAGKGEEQSYTTIWSDGKETGSDEEKAPKSGWTDGNFLTRRGRWKRLVLALLLVIIILLALILGLVLGLRADGSRADSSSPASAGGSRETTGGQADSSPSSADSSPTPTDSSAKTPDPTPSKPASSASEASALPTGAYSMITFLSTVQTDCTSDPSTWTCAPYVLYENDQSGAMATFNWNISTSPDHPDGRTISSIADSFGSSFSNVPLQLVGKGTDAERYTFQLTVDKEVRPTSSLTEDDDDDGGGGASTTCFYNSTTFQAYLYTRMARDYPPDDSGASFDPWPYAARVEEVAGGGEDAPSCYRLEDGRAAGEPIRSDALRPRPRGDLCDCLWMNWTP